MQLLDHRGEPIRRRELTREISGPTVTGVRSIWSSTSVRRLNPERLAGILREAEQPGYGASERYVELAETMEETDPHYFGVLQTRKRQVAQIGVTIEPASDAAEDVRDADLVREFFARDDLEDELFNLLDAVGKGYSAAEIVWETSERQWMPRRLEWRLPQWFDFDEVGGVRLRLRDEEGWSDLPPWKFVVHVAGAKSGIPIRGGLARLVAWSWLFKRFATVDWVRFLEAYGQPLRVGRYGPSSTEKDRDVLWKAVSNIGSDAGAIIPEEMQIEFVDGLSQTGRADIYRDLLSYLDAQISIAVLGQTLTTQSGEGGSGSYALGQVHDSVRGDIERSDARQLAATLRRDLVIPMVRLNHGERAAYPRVSIARVAKPDLKMMGETLRDLVPLGLRVRADQVRTMLDLDAPGEEDEVLAPPAPPEPPETTEATGPPGPLGAPPARARDTGGGLTSATAAAEDGAGAASLEALAARLRAEADPIVEGWLERIREDLDDASSLDDLRTRLAESEDPEGVEALAAAMGPALAAAELAGRYDVEGDPDEPALAIALAAASDRHAALPFQEQIDFFRSKVNLPTEDWTDIWQEQHERAFVVAGAARMDLLEDLRGAVDRSIAGGATLEEFRRDFAAIAKKHQWPYRGGEGWRTETIYGTNLRTSYAAGRYRQMKAIAERRPYWRYRHSHASEKPRQDHLQWDGRILRHDDPWWNTHYPPNGWGCKCYVEALNERELKRLRGDEGPDEAPEIEMRKVTVGKRGPVPRAVEVPEGIDPGWAYAPGAPRAPRPFAAPPHQSRMRQLMGADYEKLLEDSEGVAGAAARRGLSDHERVAAHTYTTDDERRGGGSLNAALRAREAGGIQLSQERHVMGLTLRDALDKLPGYPLKEGEKLYRGVWLSDTQRARYRPNEIVTEAGFTSTSTKEDAALDGDTMFVILGRRGKPSRGKLIEDLSAYPGEEEVLFKAGTEFRVVRRREEGDILRIVLEEVDDA